MFTTTLHASFESLFVLLGRTSNGLRDLVETERAASRFSTGSNKLAYRGPRIGPAADREH